MCVDGNFGAFQVVRAGGSNMRTFEGARNLVQGSRFGTCFPFVIVEDRWCSRGSGEREHGLTSPTTSGPRTLHNKLYTASVALPVDLGSFGAGVFFKDLSNHDPLKPTCSAARLHTDLFTHCALS